MTYRKIGGLHFLKIGPIGLTAYRSKHLPQVISILAYDATEAFCLVCMVAFIALALPAIIN